MGLTVSIPKTRGMASGICTCATNADPLQTDDVEIKMVDNFTYLGSVISSDGVIFEDIKVE